jgi:Carboxypeptidase regulatory-like domain
LQKLSGRYLDYTSDQNGESALLLSGKSKADGTFVVADLRPGGYWLGVTLLGVQAGSDCFQVTNRPSRKEKRALTYSWGDSPLVVSHLAGKLTERQPGTGGTPAWNHEHLVSLPIPRARLTLRNATSGPSYTTTSTEDGGFAFDSVPSGIYVLEVEYENEPNNDPRPDHVVIKINPNANGAPISFARMQSGDGTYLVRSTPRN